MAASVKLVQSVVNANGGQGLDPVLISLDQAGSLPMDDYRVKLAGCDSAELLFGQN